WLARRQAGGCYSLRCSENSGIQDVVWIESGFDTTRDTTGVRRRRQLAPHCCREALVDPASVERYVEGWRQIRFRPLTRDRQHDANDAATEIREAETAIPRGDE